MKSVPRILPLLGVAIGGVLAVNAMAGARDLQGLVSGAQAFAEEAAKGAKGEKQGAKDAAATGEAKDAAAGLPAPTLAPKAVCAPTAAELAKQAGLSPAELQVLQSLGQRRGQLDARENDLNTQLALMAAAEAKLDAKIKALNSLKTEVNGLLTQSNTKEQTEIDRLVKVFEGMKAKDAAPRLAALDDAVRIKIAARMKERSLSAIMAQMSAADAKKLTEMLARRYSDAQAAATKAAAAADDKAPAPTKTASVDPTAPEKKPATVRKAPAPRKKAPAAQQAAAKPAPAAEAPAIPSAPQPYSPPAVAPAAAPPATSG